MSSICIDKIYACSYTTFCFAQICDCRRFKIMLYHEACHLIYLFFGERDIQMVSRCQYIIYKVVRSRKCGNLHTTATPVSRYTRDWN